MNQRIKLIASDLDSTFTYEGIVPSVVKNLIFEVMNRGIKISIASGRHISDIRSIISKNEFEWGNPFPSFVISQERFILTLEGKDFKGAESWNSQRRKEIEKLTSFILSHLSKWLENLRLRGFKPEYWAIENGNILTFQYEDLEKAEKAGELIKRWVGKIFGIFIRRRCVWVEVTLSLGKGAALHHLSNILNLYPVEILAIGDSSNDLNMLDGRYGFCPAAVANAAPKIKEAVLKSGWYIASANCGDGLVEIIREFCGK